MESTAPGLLTFRPLKRILNGRGQTSVFSLERMADTMRINSRRSLGRRLLPYLLALFTVCSLVAFSASAALADSVEIYDDSHVLNTSQVRSDASSLSDPIRIYTTSDYANSNSTFDQVTKQKINTTHTLVIAINTLSRHLAIVGGSSVGLSSSQYQDAVNAFTSHFSSGGYTGATIAAIDSLKSALKGSGFGSTLLGALCCVGLLLIIGVSVFGFVRRRRGSNVAPMYNAPNQNFGAPNYGPGAYPPPQQGGVNPWVAGGLGAAGGGFVGYELGKMEGEREARREMEGQGYYGGGAFGDAGGFGGGASGNFGGDNFGGGNFGGDNFGGGGGDNFGGGDNGGSGNF